MTITAGVDIGSTATKALVLKDDQIAGFSVRSTGSDPDRSALHCLERALEKASLKMDSIEYIVSTGYGRRAFTRSMNQINEINANARAAAWLGSAAGTIRTIIDIGGQDSKVISLDKDGMVKDFIMNDKCAAGTGKFMEVIAQILEVELKDMGEISLRATKPIKIASTCVVFAQSEVISLIAQKKAKEDIIAGINWAIASRIVNMGKRIGIKDVVFFDGGPAKNIGVRKALEKELGMRVYVPKNPQVINALGAALTARDLVGG